MWTYTYVERYHDGRVLTIKCEITRAGNVTYAAQSGYHDDCVISLALAVHEITHRTRPRIYSFDDVDVWRPFEQELAMRGYPKLRPAETVEETKRDISRVWIPKLSEEGRRKKVRNILLDHEEIVQAPREEQMNALFTLMVDNKHPFIAEGLEVDKLRIDIEAVVRERFDG